MLARAAAVIATDDAAVGGRALRPVNEVVVERQLLCWMITRGQTRDEGRDCPVTGSTVTIRELLAALPVCVAWFESVANRRPPCNPRSNAMSIAGPEGCKPSWMLPVDCWLGNGTEQGPSLIEHQDIGREGIFRAEYSPHRGCPFIIAYAWQPVPRIRARRLRTLDRPSERQSPWGNSGP